jgi:hypothetical protein
VSRRILGPVYDNEKRKLEDINQESKLTFFKGKSLEEF